MSGVFMPALGLVQKLPAAAEIDESATTAVTVDFLTAGEFENEIGYFRSLGGMISVGNAGQ